MDKFKNILLPQPKDKLPTTWDEFKQILLLGRRAGVNEIGLTSVFQMGDVLMDTFDEMLPRGNIATDTKKKIDIALGRASIGEEVGRSLATDELGTKLFVQKRNTGTSTPTSTGVRLTLQQTPGTIGDIHTHPIDVMPSGGDLTAILTGTHVVKMIVTPRRVFVLVRTNKTPNFPQQLVALGYVKEMGKQKGKLVGAPSDFLDEWMPGLATDMRQDMNWTTDYASLAELHIRCYEAKRGNNVFKKTN